MPQLLVVHHSPTSSVTALTDAVVAGASDDAIEGVEVVVRASVPALGIGGPAVDVVVSGHAVEEPS